MAQINITLNQEEILQILANDQGEAFRSLLERSLNEILKAESTEQLKAGPYERTEERTDSRNGIRTRELHTRIGSIILEVPRHRNVPFRTMIFENYNRSEAALIATMVEMVVNGVSTRKVKKVVETLCGQTYSKSTVSELCKELDKDVSAFRERPLEKEYPFLIMDATYFKVRKEHRITSSSLMIAYGFSVDGKREVLGFNVYDRETAVSWSDFLQSLIDRGLHGVKMVISDAHEGIIKAVSDLLVDVPWQRCQFHFARNILDKTPKSRQDDVKRGLREMFDCTTIEEARNCRDKLIREHEDTAAAAMKCLDEGFEDSMTVMALPEKLRRTVRTSNTLERLNRELKRRSHAIGIFPNDASLLRLMGAVLIEYDSKVQASSYTAFNKAGYAQLCRNTEKLVEIAREQRRLLAA